MPVVSMNYLLEAGVHFGHQTKRWNPKMKEYIFCARDDIYIIDLQKTAKKIEAAYAVLYKIAANGGKVLFVGTRKQASDAIREEAIRSNSYYVTERWLGGTLTNFKTIRKRVKRLEEIEKMERDGILDVLPKKVVSRLRKEYEKLNKLLVGIRHMNKLPDALFVVDPSKEIIAVREARKLGIPIFGIVDTNCDPDLVDYVIPGNDDAIRAVKLIVGVMTNAIVEATGGKIIDFVSDEDKHNRTKNDVDIMKKVLETIEPKVEKDESDKKANTKKANRKEKKIKTKSKKKEEKVDSESITEKEESETVVVSEETEKADLSKLTVAELRKMAKEKNIKGYSTMKKAELLEALK